MQTTPNQGEETDPNDHATATRKHRKNRPAQPDAPSGRNLCGKEVFALAEHAVLIYPLN